MSGNGTVSSYPGCAQGTLRTFVLVRTCKQLPTSLTINHIHKVCVRGILEVESSCSAMQPPYLFLFSIAQDSVLHDYTTCLPRQLVTAKLNHISVFGWRASVFSSFSTVVVIKAVEWATAAEPD